MAKELSMAIALLASAASAYPCDPVKPDASPVVTTREAAVAAAKHGWESIHRKATWNETFSKITVTRFEPYSATLNGGVWHVVGTRPRNFDGPMPEAFVCQSDGAVDARVSGRCCAF
jgi:hypothetical protein